MVHSGALHISGRPRGPKPRGPGVAYLPLLHPLDGLIDKAVKIHQQIKLQV